MAKTADPAHRIRLLSIHTPGFVNPDYINKNKTFRVEKKFYFPLRIYYLLYTITEEWLQDSQPCYYSIIWLPWIISFVRKYYWKL